MRLEVLMESGALGVKSRHGQVRSLDELPIEISPDPNRTATFAELRVTP